MKLNFDVKILFSGFVILKGLKQNRQLLFKTFYVEIL